MRRILITGYGLLGQATTRHLRQHARLAIVEKSDVATRAAAADHPEASVYRACIGDGAAMENIVASVKPDVVIHTASLLGPAFKADPSAGERINVEGPLRLAEAAARYGATRFVFASSLAVYDFGDCTSDLAEDAAKTVDDVYGLAKLRVEAELGHMVTQRFSTASLRFSGIFGWSSRPVGGWSATRLLEIVSNHARDGAVHLDEAKFGSNEYLYAADAGHATMLASAGTASVVCNVGSGRVTPFPELVDAFAFALGRDTVSSSRSTGLLADYLRRTRPLDISVARRALGYQPGHSFRAGIEDLVRQSRCSTLKVDE